MKINNLRSTLGLIVMICAFLTRAQTDVDIVNIKTASDSALVVAGDSTSSKDNIDKIMKAAADAVAEEALEKTDDESGSTRSLGAREERDGISITDEDTIPLYEDGYGGLSKLNSKVSDYKVFINGENHTYTESNARLWLKMIKYLNENAGVRNIMFEYGYSYGFLVNEYLKTGDTTLINSIDQFAYMEYSDVIRELKVYNDSLPENRKLYFAAIDIERGAYPIAKNLEYLLPSSVSEASDSIQLHIRSLKSLADYNDYKLDEMDEEDGTNSRGFTFKTNATLQLVQTNFSKFENDYKAYLGKNFELFKSVIIDRFNARKLWYEYDNSGAIQQYIYREQYMYRQFLSEAAEHPGAWFGQFGRCHTTKDQVSNNSCEWFVFNSLADQIEHTTGGEYEGRVLTTAIAYKTDRNFGEKYKASQESLSPYFEDIEADRVGLVEVDSDTALRSGYGDDFDYIIFNTYEERGKAYKYLNEYNDYANSEDDSRVFIEGGIGSVAIDFDEMNTMFSVYNATSTFYNSLDYWDVSLGIQSGGGYSATQGGIYRGQNREVSDSNGNPNDYKLSGYFFKSMGGYDILKNKKWIDVIPMIGFVYQHLSVDVEELAQVSGDLTDGQFGELKNTRFINDAFVIEGASILRFNVGPVSLSTQLGYQLDISKKTWKTGKTHLTTGPETSFAGMYQTVRIGLNF